MTGVLGLTPEKKPERRLLDLWVAAVTEIIPCASREIVTGNIKAGLFESCCWNENKLKPLARINWRASLVPAAAVIPAPIRNIKFVAVKKLVVEFLRVVAEPHLRNLLRVLAARMLALTLNGLLRFVEGASFTVNKTKRSWQALSLNESHGIMKTASLVFAGSRMRLLVNRNSWGYSYFNARGEILGLLNDERLRRHLPRMFSLIKNESLGIEDD